MFYVARCKKGKGRNMKKFLAILAIGSGLAVRADAKLMDLTHFKLDNGLEAVVIENHKAPVALQMLYYKTGSVNDPNGKGGLAHLTEHLMFRGTKKVKDGEFNRLTAKSGAENNAYTTFNETGYYEFSDISKLELMMALEADRMTGLDISDEAFEAERAIVLEERMQRFENQPAPLFYEAFNRILWQEGKAANPVSGSVADIKGLRADDARAFYKRWYRPDNAVLVLAGDITAREAQVLVNKYFGGIKVEGELSKSEEDGKGRAFKSLFSMQLDGVSQPRFVSAFRLEGGEYEAQEILALELLSEYLAGDDTSYLAEKLVYGKKELLSVGTGVSYDAKLGGTVSFAAVPANGGDAASLEALIDAAVNEGVAALTDEELDKIKNYVLSEAVYLAENPESAARFAGNMLLSGYTAEEISLYDEAIKKVTAVDVKEAWAKVLSKAKGHVSGYLEGKGGTKEEIAGGGHE